MQYFTHLDDGTHHHRPDGTDLQTQNVLAKINGLFEWAKSVPWVAGFNPWHYHSRGGNQAPGHGARV
jgi:hypothetical protein